MAMPRPDRPRGPVAGAAAGSVGAIESRGAGQPVGVVESGAATPAEAGRERIGFPLARPGGEEAPAEADRPYMDPDGTLHNLRPIARLEMSGPTEPQRTAESAFGSGWFVTKTPAGAADVDGDEGRSGEATLIAGPGSAGTAAEGTRRAAGPANGSEADGHAPAAGHGVPGEPDAVSRPARHASAVGDTASAGEQGERPAPGQEAGHAAAGHAAAGQDRTGPAASPVADGQHAATMEAAPTGQNGAATEAAATGQHATATEAATTERDAAATEAATTGRDATATEAAGDEREPGPELAPHLPLTAADLSAIRWRLDGATLREVVDDRQALRDLGERLDGPLADEADNIVKAGLLSVRAEVYRLLGELGMAAAASRLALAHAESAQDLQSQVIAQAELAHVLRLRGDYMEADRLFQRAVDAEVPAAVRSVVHENAGRSCFDQGRHMEALDHFARAVRLGAAEDTDLVERIGVCLEAVYIHVLRDGWGPYPRRSPEILTPLTGRPAADGGSGRAAEPARADASAETTAEHPEVRPRG
ncbi:hypothetical protein [Actinoplanes utahensis]